MLSNLSEVLQVCLAANQDSLRVDVILLAPLAILKLLPPLLHTVECFPVCNIVGHHHRVRPPVVEGANWGELFLASRVPQISAVSRAQSETGSELDKSYYCYQIWSLTILSSTEKVLILKSTPMVVIVSQWKLLSTYLFIRDVLPQV